MEPIGSFDDQPVKTRLPRDAYLSQDYYDEEMERIFRPSWVAIGVGAQLPEPGFVHPVTIAGEPLLITRDKAGALHVFRNACRHRGLKLVEDAGPNNGSKIVCPYHRWWYGLDGGLKGTPYWDKAKGNSAPDGEMMKSLSLVPVRFAVWMDIVFVNLSGDAPPFDEYIAPVEERWSSLDKSDLVNIHCSAFVKRANWKLVTENFLDYYHLSTVHPAVGGVENTNNYEDVVLRPDILGATWPMAGTEFGGFDDPDAPFPKFVGTPSHLEGGMDLLGILPNALLILTANWFQVILPYPDGPENSNETFAAYAPAAFARPENARQVEDLNEFLVEVNGEDVLIVERMHAGRRSPVSDEIYFTGSWDYTQIAFQDRIASVMNGA